MPGAVPVPLSVVAVVVVVIVVIVVVPVPGGLSGFLLVSTRCWRLTCWRLGPSAGGGEEGDEAVPGVALDRQVTGPRPTAGLSVTDGGSGHGQDWEELGGGWVTAGARPVREDNQLGRSRHRNLGLHLTLLAAAVLLLWDVDGHGLLTLLPLGPGQLGLGDHVVDGVGVVGAGDGAADCTADGTELVRSDQFRPDQTVSRLGRDVLGRGGRGGGRR